MSAWDGTDRRSEVRREDDRVVSRVQLTGVAVAYLILLLSLAVGLWALERRDIKRTEESALRTCERVNVLRRAINDNALVLSASVQVSILREKKLADDSATRLERGTHQASVASLTALGHYYLFRPLTDCELAVKHPDEYKPPGPRPFTQKQLSRIKLPKPKHG